MSTVLKILLGLVVLLIVAAAMGGIYWAMTKKPSKGQQQTEEPTGREAKNGNTGQYQ
jgi:flagellar basal body-associated protein FliL